MLIDTIASHTYCCFTCKKRDTEVALLSCFLNAKFEHSGSEEAHE